MDHTESSKRFLALKANSEGSVGSDARADFLGATEAQVKNWLQEARAFMRARYASSCALISKQGVCYQCIELADYFKSGEQNPLAGSADDMDGRLSILQEMRRQLPGLWHAKLLQLIDDLD